MDVLLIVFISLAAVFTAQQAQRAGTGGARLRWLAFALGVVGVLLALWTVGRHLADHRRNDTPSNPTASR